MFPGLLSWRCIFTLDRQNPAIPSKDRLKGIISKFKSVSIPEYFKAELILKQEEFLSNLFQQIP
jgi:hypothetical protein